MSEITNEIGAAVVDLPSGAEAAGAVVPHFEGISPPDSPAATSPARYSRIGEAEHNRRMAVIARFHATEAWTWKQIGVAVGMSTDRIQRWWEAQQRVAEGKPRRARVYPQKGDVQLKPGQTRRVCMTCKTPFASDGPHHRLCHDHRLAGSGSPLAPDPGGSTGRCFFFF